MSTRKAEARKPGDLLTVAEVAAELRISPRAVRRLTQTGELAFYQFGTGTKGKKHIEWSEVQRFKASRRGGLPTTPTGAIDHLALRGRRR